MSRKIAEVPLDTLDQWDKATAMGYVHMCELKFDKNVIPWLLKYRRMRKDGLYDKEMLKKFMTQKTQYI